jgi:hypothetical protein
MIPQIVGGFTRMPNYFLDEQLGKLSPVSFAALAYICRRTLGFNQLTARIPLRQFESGYITADGRVLDNGAGISNRRTLLAALAELREKGLIEYSSVRGQETAYTVILPASSESALADEKASGNSATGQVAEVPLAESGNSFSRQPKKFSRKKDFQKKKESRSYRGPIDFSKYEPGGKYAKLVK